MKKIILSALILFLSHNLFAQTWQGIFYGNDAWDFYAHDGQVDVSVFSSHYDGTQGTLTVNVGSCGIRSAKDYDILTWKSFSAAPANPFVVKMRRDGKNYWLGTRRLTSDYPMMSFYGGNIFFCDSTGAITELKKFKKSVNPNPLLVTDDVNCIERIDSFIFVGSYNGMFRIKSVNDSVEDISNGMTTNKKNITSVTQKDSYLFAAESTNGIYRSADNGNTWTLLPKTGAISTVTALNYIKVVGDNMFLLTDKGIFRAPVTTPGGTITWTKTSTGLVFSSGDAHMETMITDADTLYAGYFTGEIYRSTNNGDNWSLFLNPPAAESNVAQLEMQIDRPFFYGVFNGNVYRYRINACDATKPVIHEDNSGLLSTDDYLTYQWTYLGYGAIPGETDKTLTPPASGKYSVSVTDASICNKTSSYYTYNLSTSVNAENINEQVVLVSNPVKNEIDIAVSENLKTDLVTLLGIDGKELLRYSPVNSSGYMEIPVADIASGIYFLKLKTNKGIAVKKIIIE